MSWLVDTLAMGDKNYSHTHRRNSEGVCVQLLSAEMQFINLYL